MKTQTTRQTVEVRADGEGLVSHAGAFLLVELADRLELAAALSEAMASARERRSTHDPGVVLRDLAIAIADGGDHVSDLGVLRAQEALFGAVASETTAHRDHEELAKQQNYENSARGFRMPATAGWLRLNGSSMKERLRGRSYIARSINQSQRRTSSRMRQTLMTAKR